MQPPLRFCRYPLQNARAVEGPVRRAEVALRQILRRRQIIQIVRVVVERAPLADAPIASSRPPSVGDRHVMVEVMSDWRRLMSFFPRRSLPNARSPAVERIALRRTVTVAIIPDRRKPYGRGGRRRSGRAKFSRMRNESGGERGRSRGACRKGDHKRGRKQGNRAGGDKPFGHCRTPLRAMRQACNHQTYTRNRQGGAARPLSSMRMVPRRFPDRRGLMVAKKTIQRRRTEPPRRQTPLLSDLLSETSHNLPPRPPQ